MIDRGRVDSKNKSLNKLKVILKPFIKKKY